MAQIKKDEVRARILAAAEDLFSGRGYVETTMTAISVSAGISKSNIYVYFGSKLEILWAISDPWLRSKFQILEDELEHIENPNERLRHLFTTLWVDLPADKNGFANNMMQALSTTTKSNGYSRELLAFCEDRFTELLAKCLTSIPDDVQALSHIAFMAFDGFSIGRQLGAQRAEEIRSAHAFADLISQRGKT